MNSLIMRTVKKFVTFDELKAFEGKALKPAASLKKHNAFKKFIMDVRDNKTYQANQSTKR